MKKIRHTVKSLRNFGPLPEGVKQIVRIDESEPRLRSFQYKDSIRFRVEVCAFSKRYTKSLDKWPCDIESQRDAARRFSLEVRGGDCAQGGSMKVRDFFRQVHLPDVQVRNKTAKDVEQRFKRFLDGYLGDCRLDQVTTSYLEMLPLKLKALGYANQTVNHYLCDTRTLFNKMVEHRRLNQSPARFLKNLPVDNVPVVSELTVDRLSEFIDACEQDESPVHTEYGIVIAGTGLRDSECRSIKVGQIDMAITRIWIPKNKAGRPFYVPVNSTVKRAIGRRFKALGIQDLETHKRRADEYLFPSPVKPNASIGYPRAFFSRVSDRLGLKVNPHCLRRLWALAVAQSSGNLDIASRMLNHSSAAVTKRYVTYAAPELQKASDTAEQYLLGTQLE
jgi:integrase